MKRSFYKRNSNCTDLQGFMIHHSFGGGTGSFFFFNIFSFAFLIQATTISGLQTCFRKQIDRRSSNKLRSWRNSQNVLQRRFSINIYDRLSFQIVLLTIPHIILVLVETLRRFRTASVCTQRQNSGPGPHNHQDRPSGECRGSASPH